MASKDTPQENTDDMSIDELSAAIDAHMTEIDKPKLKKKPAAKTSIKNEPTPAAEKKEEPKEEPKDEGGHTKIAVKHAYVSKKDKKNSAALPDKEKSQVIHTSNVKLKPISEADKDIAKPATKTKSDIVDVVVKTPEKTKEPKEAAQKVEVKSKELAPEKPAKQEVKETVEKPVAKPEPEKQIETVEKPVIKPETTQAIPPAQRTNSADDLSAQMPTAKPSEAPADIPEGETMKTFDTKQYHIPIKASHHHRKGGSFKVFIAVLAVILATVYVLNELDIIDIAEFISAY